MSKRDYKNDKEVRAQVEVVLKLRERYHAVSEERAAIAKQGTAELKKLERLIAGAK
jgi:hypothetical protein